MKPCQQTLWSLDFLSPNLCLFVFIAGVRKVAAGHHGHPGDWWRSLQHIPAVCYLRAPVLNLVFMTFVFGFPRILAGEIYKVRKLFIYLRVMRWTESGSHLFKADLKLSIQLKMTLNSNSSCVYLPSVRITDVTEITRHLAGSIRWIQPNV